MKLKPVKFIPFLIAGGVILLVGILRLVQPGFTERLEWMTYDARVRVSTEFPQTVATNLGFVYISDDSITALANGSLKFKFGLYWPRQIYGRVLRELTAQDARTVAFDVMFSSRRSDHTDVPVVGTQWPDLEPFLTELHRGEKPTSYKDGSEEIVLVSSDDYFAWQLARSGRAVLASERTVLPEKLFANNALAIADISAEKDRDGVLRRAKAFYTYRHWHKAFRQIEADPEYGVDLGKARIEKGHVILPRSNGEKIRVPVDRDNTFDLADFVGGKLPPGMPARDKAFTEERVWHMGIALAAQELGLNLDEAQVDLPQGKITLRGANGVERIIPVNSQGYFHINWEISPRDPRLMAEPFESLLKQDQLRSGGISEGVTNRWQGRLVVIGSSATGNELTDRGATSMEKDTLYVSKHWNVANSIITGRFVRQSSLGVDWLLIAVLGTLTAWATWQLRAVTSAAAMGLLIMVYSGVAVWLYVQSRLWIPIVLPTVGAVLANYLCLLTYRVIFEQRERRRVKSVFSKVVSPDVVNELLGVEDLKLGGARRELTVLFADVRGFTELTDVTQEKAVDYVREHKLAGAEAEKYYDEVARETLSTVNLYLALTADQVKKHGGTLDKYIGDCVMAFWGAPTATPQHALLCVRTAIDAQRAMHETNKQRTELNRQVEIENRARLSAGMRPKPLLATLSLGTGINTGSMTVGMMGSEANILNYTVFGREVNLASRLEHESGRGRIVISETTYQHLQQTDKALAATCVELPPVTVKGIRTAVKIYEVPWRLPEQLNTTITARPPEPLGDQTSSGGTTSPG